MKRRVCETCHFYAAAGLANSGWCRHPDRQFGTGVRLIVRGNEVACRNGWNADLWLPAGIDPGADPLPPSQPPHAEQPADQITSIVPARYEQADTPPATTAPATDDIVVHHAPYSQYAAPEKQARDLVTNPRAAILKAREQFKDRQLREGRIADRQVEPPRFATTDEIGLPHSNEDGGDLIGDQNGHRQENAPFLGGGGQRTESSGRSTVPPVTPDEVTRPYVTITHFPEDVRRFESVPTNPGHNQAAPAESVSPPNGTAQARRNGDLEPSLDSGHEDDFEDFGDRADAFDGYDELDDYLIAENGQYADAPRRRVSLFERFRRRRDRHGHRHQPFEFERDSEEALPDGAFLAEPAIELEPDSSVSVVLDQTLDDKDPWLPRPQASVDRHGVERHLQERAGMADSDPQVNDFGWTLTPLERVEPEYLNSHGEGSVPFQASWRPDDLPRWDAVDQSIEQPPRVPPVVERPLHVAPDLPRICRTCRDFRAAESGDRGWCNNAWAFRHRRMVDAGVLSCETSYGVWWLPHDYVWQKAVDVSRHAQETPLFDRYFGPLDDHHATPLRREAGRRR